MKTTLFFSLAMLFLTITVIIHTDDLRLVVAIPIELFLMMIIMYLETIAKKIK